MVKGLTIQNVPRHFSGVKLDFQDDPSPSNQAL